LALEPTKGSMLAPLLVVPRLVCHGAFGALQISGSSPLLGNLLSLHLHLGAQAKGLDVASSPQVASSSTTPWHPFETAKSAEINFRALLTDGVSKLEHVRAYVD